MLWGAALSVGAEAFRRHDDSGQAIGLAITGTQHVLESFINRTKSADCLDVSECDYSSKISFVKFMITGKFLSCFTLAEKWAPEAIQSANEGLSRGQTDLPQQPVSCASEVVKKMGASDEEACMVAGFAGGLGLSGNACGALSAAIWMKTLALHKKQTGKVSMFNPDAKNTLETFYNATDHEILCSKISGQSFKTIADHTEFIKNGGCNKLIDILAQP